MEFFSQRMAGDLLNRQTANASIANNLVNTVGPLVLDTIMMVFYLVIMLRYNVFMTMIGLGSMLLSTKYSLIPQLLSSISNYAVLFLGVILAMNGQFTIGMIVTFQGILSSFMSPAGKLIESGQTIQDDITDPYKQLHLLVGVGSFLLASAFASVMIGIIRDLLVVRIATKASLAVESSVMMRVLSLPMSFFRDYSSGELMNRVNSVSALCSMLIQNTLSLGLGGLLSLLYVTQIFQFAPALVLPAVLIVLLTVTVSIASSVYQVKITREKMLIQAQESGLGYAMLTGIQKIKLTGSEKRIFSQWGNLHVKSANLEFNPPLFLKLNPVIIQVISLAGTVVLYYMAIASQVNTSQYYAFNAAYGRLMGAFTALAGIAISVSQVRPILEMAEPILKTSPELTSERAGVGKLSGHIEMNHISFRYSEEMPYVFQDLSLSVQPGEYVAIVGRTGCGKSTLVRLLLGFEKPENGTVFYDQYDLNHSDPRSIRKQIGVVMQNGQLLNNDIYSNITLSAPLLSVDEAWEAAEIAGIAEDIKNMPMGMFTMISEGDGGISGGQKQRLMIARAIAPKPRILMVQDGAIAEEGTYEELIEKGGEFADLVARQRLDQSD